MKITNKLGLPEAFVQMAKINENVSPKKVRATSLLNGCRETLLRKRHFDEIEVDVADMIWLLFGTAVHAILERQKEAADEFKEERLEMQISNTTLTGKSDLYSNGVITDYKTCSTWGVRLKDFDKWKKQIMVYAMLWDSYGFPVKGGVIIPIMKDHKKREAQMKPNEYPPYPVGKIEFKITKKDIADTRVWVEDKIRELERLENVPDDALPLCTEEERWNRGTKYAVMKKGRKTAKRVLDTKAEAEKWMRENGGDYIETRPGEDSKCLNYCQVKEFCRYGRSLG